MKGAARPLLLVALALSAYFGIAAGLRRHIPLPEGYDLRSKYEVFAGHRDDYDAVYIGSSRLFRAFRPDVIDPLLSRPGRPFRSFNLGMAGMGSFEADALLDRVLDLAPARLSWVVIEVPTWTPHLGWQFSHNTERSVSWHAPRQTATALVSLRRMTDAPLASRLETARDHLWLLARWQANLGRGPRLWQACCVALSAEQREARRVLLESGGYQSLEHVESESFLKRRRRFVARIDKYKAVSRWRARHPDTPQPGLPPSYNLAALEAQQRRVARAGARAVYTMVPGFPRDLTAQRLALAGYLPALIDLTGPDRYPELYEPENRFDEGHFSESGAAVFSRLFAMELGALMQTAAVAPPDGGR